MAVTALGVWCVAAVYRFNTLGDTFGGFHNDEFLVISRAAQMLRGDLPVRDFFDPGAPLAYASTAGAMKVVGYHLGAEALLTVGALAFGAALIVWLVSQATGSIPTAAIAALLAVAAGPRYYNYPKIILYAVALILMWRYIDVPGRGRVVPLAVFTVVAFLFRHDHGAYVSVLSVVTVVAAAAPIWRAARAPMVTYALVAALCMAPYIVYLQLNGGVVGYFRSALAWAARDAERTQLTPPSFRIDGRAPVFLVSAPEPLPPPHIKIRWQSTVTQADRTRLERAYGLEPRRHSEGSYDLHDASARNVEALVREPAIVDTDGINRTSFVLGEPPAVSVWGRLRREFPLLRLTLAPGVLRRENGLPFLYQLAVWMPAVALVTFAVARRRIQAASMGWPHAQRKLVVLIAFTGLLTFTFLRGSLESRIADVSVPIAVLGAWLAVVHARPSLGGWRVLRLPVVAALVLLTAFSVNAESRVVTELRRTGFLLGPGAVVRRMDLVWSRLSESPPLPTVAYEGEPPIFSLARYVNRCTAETDRVLGVAFMPELYFYAQRGFAGGLMTVQPGFSTDPAAQQTAIARLERQSVPIVVTENAQAYATLYARDFPLIVGYVDRHYREAGAFPIHSDVMRVLARRDRTPSATDAASGLPCFR